MASFECALYLRIDQVDFTEHLIETAHADRRVAETDWSGEGEWSQLVPARAPSMEPTTGRRETETGVAARSTPAKSSGGHAAIVSVLSNDAARSLCRGTKRSLDMKETYVNVQNRDKHHYAG